MKKFYSSLLVLLFAFFGLVQNVKGQTVVFGAEGFGTGASLPTGWTAGSSWSVANASSSSGYTNPTASGGSNATIATGAITSGAGNLTTPIINFSGHTHGALWFGLRSSSTSFTSDLTVSVDIGGAGTFTAFTATVTNATMNSGGFGSGGGNWALVRIDLGTAIDNQSQVQVRFGLSAKSSGGNLRIDDVELVATPYSDPSPYDLSSSNYSFTTWAASSTAVAYPTSMIFHYGNYSIIDPTLSQVNASEDYASAYNLTSSSRIEGQGSNGISFINTSNGHAASGGNLGEAVLALNTTGRNNIQVSWTAGTLVAGTSIYKLRAQYRVGTSSSYTDLPNIATTQIEYTSTGAVDLGTNYGPITLPVSCEGQPIIEIRWVYYYSSGSGTRTKINLTNISVTSSAPNTATLSSMSSQPSAPLTTGTSNNVLGGFSISSSASVNFTAVTVTTPTAAGSATSGDISNVRIYKDNNGDGIIDGADASISGIGITYSSSINFTVSDPGITAGNYLIVADVASNANITHSLTASIASGAFTTTATTNTGSATGNTLNITTPFTAGHLIVYRVGDGTTSLVNTGNPVFMDEYQTNGTLVQSSVELPTVNGIGNTTNKIIGSGTAASEGLLTLSSDCRYVLATGYKASTTDGITLSSSASGSVPRVIARIGADATINTTTALTDFSTGNNPRSAVSSDGTNIWFGGAGGGVGYTTLGSTTTTATVSTTVTNIRQVNIFNGQLYMTTGSGSTNVTVNAVGTGLPTTGGQSLIALSGLPNGGTSPNTSPYSYYLAILPQGQVLYIADNIASTISKYSLVSGTWTSNGSVTASSVLGLTGTITSGTTSSVTLYGTTSGASGITGAIYSVTDASGFDATMTGSVISIATASTNETFRGIGFAPVSAAISLSNPGNQSLLAGPGSVHFTHDANSTVIWTVTSSTISGLSAGSGIGDMSFTASAGTASVTAYAYYGDKATTPVTFTITVLPTTATLAGIATQPSGNIEKGASFTVLAGFTITAASPGVTFSTVTVTSTGTATSSDISNVRIFKDANGNGVLDPGEVTVSGAGISYSASMPFTISGETGITSGTYLIVADVASGATSGNTVTVNVTGFTSNAISNTGTASSNLLTISSASTPGNLFIYRVGDGSASLVNTGNPIFMDEYTPAGVLTRTVALPTANGSGNNEIIGSGVAISEGLLTLSTDCRYVLGTGYKALVTDGTDLVNSTSTAVPRVVARINANAAVNTATALTDFSSGNNPRSAVSTDGTNIWISGAGDGIKYTTLSSTTSTQLSTSVTNTAQVNIFNGQLYETSEAGGGFNAVGTVGSWLPTSSGQTITTLSGLPNGGSLSPYSFYIAILPAGQVLYITDDGNNTISKYSLVAGTWTANGSVTASGIRGLTGTITSGTTSSVTLYGTTNGATGITGTMYTVTDASGFNATMTGTVTSIVTASANEGFRGIAFVPVSSAISLANPGNLNFCNGLGSVCNAHFTHDANSTVIWTVTSSTITGLPAGSGIGDIIFTPTSTGTANVTAYAYYGDKTTASVSFTISLAPPTIGGGGQPSTATQTVCLNAVATLSVTAAAGSGSISTYKWYSNTSQSSAPGATGTLVATHTNSSTTDTYTLPTTTPGTLYYYCIITNSNGCPVTSNPSGAIIVSTTDTWTGTSGTDWGVGTNWGCGVVPTAASDVIVPNVTNQPVLSGSVTVNTLTMQPFSNLAVGNNTLTLNGAFSGSSTGTINASAGSGLVIGGTAGTIYFGTTSNTLSTFTINDGASATLGSALNIASTGMVTVGSSLGAILTTGGNLTLLSDDNGSARIGQVPVSGGLSLSTISGNVNVQCYIHSSTAGAPRRGWRLITAPVTDAGASPVSTIYSAWQNDGVYAPGLGTMITMPPSANYSGSGLDDGINGNYSDYTWNPASQQLVKISNTASTDISGTAGNADNIGYFIFIRGDRDPSTIGNPASAVINNTTLTSSGPLQLGDQVFSSSNDVVSATANGLSLIGNPYACSIDFSELAGDKSGYPTSYLNNVINRYYVWNSNLTGSSGVGGYVCFDDASNTTTYTESVGGSGTAGPQDLSIQSGQAIFVQTLNTAPASVTFKESTKSSANNFVFRPVTTPTSAPAESVVATLSLLNSDSTTSLTDGVVAQYKNSYCDCVDYIDAPKFSNTDEMFSLARHGKQLSIERRPQISGNDTLFLNLQQLHQRNYQFNFANHLSNPLLEGHLIDSYTGTQTPLNMAGTNTVNFSVDANAASQVQNRFMIVMDISSTLPVVYSNANAILLQGNDVAVQWTVQDELNIRQYEVQRSTDQANFNTVIGIIPAKSGSANSYSLVDSNAVAGDSYYRVVSIGNDGSVAYSQVMHINNTHNTEAGINVYPNPAKTGETINLRFTNMPEGNYAVQLIDNAGRIVLARSIAHDVNAIETIVLPRAIAAETYTMEITAPDHTVSEINIAITN